DPEYLLEHVIEARALTVIYGPSGEGKTYYTLNASLSVAHGKPCFGLAVKQRPVVYVVGEGTGGIKKRVAAWKKHHNVELVRNAFFVLSAVQLMILAEV